MRPKTTPWSVFVFYAKTWPRASEKKRRRPDIIPGSFIIYKGPPCVRRADVKGEWWSERVYLFLIPQSLLQCTPLGSGQKVGLLVFVCVRRISSHFAFQQTTAVFYPLACGMDAEWGLFAPTRIHRFLLGGFFDTPVCEQRNSNAHKSIHAGRNQTGLNNSSAGI